MDRTTRHAYLEAMGIQAWELRELPETPVVENAQEPRMVEAPAEPTPPGLPEADVGNLDWDGLADRVRRCTACDLSAGRTQTVFGVGDPGARLMLIGEAPGADEDRQGEPFVGKAGQLLNEMLLAIGLRREQVYIANILKCRPPQNRDPQPSEVACCEPYLKRQLELIRPRLVVALGRVAAHNLLKTQTSLARLRGQLHAYGEQQTPVLVTYHPAYLLRTPQDKRKAWQDLQFVRKYMTAEPLP